MVERRLIAVEGVVQGVGFRPYVHRLATANALRGFVRNDASGVLIDVEGDASRVEDFLRALTVLPPPLAAISRMQVEVASPGAYDSFRIVPSDSHARERSTPLIAPDVATCDGCLAELFDATNRRFGHAFITCTDCGPRFTIVRAMPYDRERTTMAGFPMCEACRREYADPSDRRFHAEAIACPSCGPRLISFRSADPGSRVADREAFAAAVAALCSGEIVAVKALGGYHLACDATKAATVERLRSLKRRVAKPFAVMVANVEGARSLCIISEAEAVALQSPARPIVLLERRIGAHVAGAVAPAPGMLGVMLPSTPLHHLLLAAFGRPLVMTSGNQSNEPVVTAEENALATLGGIADVFLTHDRPIAARCDDSVVRVAAGETRLIRRARGYAPQGMRLPGATPQPVIALGGHLKNTVCFAAGERAVMSAHIGDLDSLDSRLALRDTVKNLMRIAGGQAAVIAHDLHPEYGSTQLADELARELKIVRRVSVQHHHAHVAACVVEYMIREPVVGVVFDGAGLGTDGAIWGGEFLVVDGAGFDRHGHMAYVPLPGGDAAARRPWRSAAAHLSCATNGAERVRARPQDVEEAEWKLVHRLLASPENLPRTSSVGRLFDAVASLLGVCHVARYEGEAAMALESIADAHGRRSYPVSLSAQSPWTVDMCDVVCAVVDDQRKGRSAAEIAGAFHNALRDVVVAGCERVRLGTGLSTVVLTGGVFMNALLLSRAREALLARKFRVLIPRLVPCNDGGLSLGQAWVGVRALEEDLCA